MNILIIIISLFLGVFVRPIFATEINIEVLESDGITVGNTFPITFNIAEAEPESAYYFKIYGGPVGDNFSIQTYNQNNNQFLSYDAAWMDLPIFYTDYLGNATVNGIAKIPFDKNYCYDNFYYCYQLFVDIADLASETVITDVPSDLMVFPSASTPTIGPTSNPTPTFTPTLKPTLISNSRLVPTLTPTPTPNMKIFGTSTSSANLVSSTPSESDFITKNTDSTFIEAGSNQSQPSTTSPTLKKTNFVPFIFLTAGILFLIFPLVFFKIKNK